MSVTLVLGPGGSGKGYLAAHQASRWLARGHEVFANFPLAGAQMFGKDDLPYLPPGKVIIDEPQDWFNSRDWSRMDDVQRRRITKTRHAKWDLWLLTQHEDQLDKVLRLNAHYAVVVTPAWKSATILGRDSSGRLCVVPFEERHPLYFTVRKWHYADRRSTQKGRRPIHQRRVWFRWKIARMYDTHQHARLVEEVGNLGSFGWRERFNAG